MKKTILLFPAGDVNALKVLRHGIKNPGNERGENKR
jgi:hypothetical protein